MMRLDLLFFAALLSFALGSCSDCDPEGVVWIGSFSGTTECFDTTTVTDVLILQGSAENNYEVIINGSDPLQGFSTSCEMQLPRLTVPVSQIESAFRSWEITIDGNELDYKETSTSSISGLGISCEGILLRQ